MLGQRILVAIAAYESLNNPFLLKSLGNYRDACEHGHDVLVHIHTADFWGIEAKESLSSNFSCLRTNSPLNIVLEVFEKDVGLHLTEKHRNTIALRKNDHDLFIYQEDDIGLTLEHINMFISNTNTLTKKSSNFDEMLGYLRYEEINEATTYFNGDLDMAVQKPNGGRFIIEMPLPLFGLHCIGNIPYILDNVNPHQAFWMMTRDQLLHLEQKCDFLHQQHHLLREERATMVYMSSFSIFKADPRVYSVVGLQEGISCNVSKVIPLRDFLRSGVHHMRQKYAAKFPVVTIDDVQSQMIEWARDPGARARGEVPPCWQLAVDG